MAAALIPTGVSALSKIGSILGSIIGQQHAAAVKAEANNLNAAVPQYRNNLTAIVNAFNQGQISSQQAFQAVDESVIEYYDAVQGIIKDSSNRGSNCSNLSSNCNGPCVVGCDWIVKWAQRLKSGIQTGGVVQFDAIPSHAGFNGMAPWSLTVAHPAESSLTSNANLSIAGPGVSPLIATVPGVAAVVNPTSGIVASSSQSGLNSSTILLLGFAGLAALISIVAIPSRK